MFLMSDVLFSLDVNEDHVGQHLIDESIFLGRDAFEMSSDAFRDFD